MEKLKEVYLKSTEKAERIGLGIGNNIQISIYYF